MDKKKNIFASAKSSEEVAFMLWGAVDYASKHEETARVAIKKVKELVADAYVRQRELYDEWYAQLDESSKALVTYRYADSKTETEQEA